MEQDKRMAGDYEITSSFKIDDREIVYGVSEQADNPYMCAYYTWNDLFGLYDGAIGSDDYIEIIELFAERIKVQCEKVKEENKKVCRKR